MMFDEKTEKKEKKEGKEENETPRYPTFLGNLIPSPYPDKVQNLPASQRDKSNFLFYLYTISDRFPT